jgi:hypothetical protein
VVLPRVRAGLDRREPVRAVVARDDPADPGEVRVERRRVLVALVHVATGGVRLPDLDELVAHGSALAVEDPSGHDDPLAERLAGVLDREIGLVGRDVGVAESGRDELDLLGIRAHEFVGGMPEHGRAVRREVAAGVSGERAAGGVRGVALETMPLGDLVVDGLLARLGLGYGSLHVHSVVKGRPAYCSARLWRAAREPVTYSS